MTKSCYVVGVSKYWSKLLLDKLKIYSPCDQEIEWFKK